MTDHGPPLAAAGLAASMGELVQHFEAGAAALNDLPDNVLFLGSLRKAVEHLLTEARVAHVAATALAEGTPIADSFPDGGRMPPSPTPRQVVYLADLARVEPPPEGDGRRRGEVLAQHDAAHGKQRSRPCAEEARNGGSCRSSALGFIERPVCSSHASESERATNRARREAWLQNHPFPEVLRKTGLRY